MIEKKIYALSNGNRVVFTRNPPFGFWTVNYAKGQLPKHLSGQYRGLGGAMTAFKSYAGCRGVSITKEIPWPEARET